MGNDVHWTRGELKKRSKGILRLHYWRLVLATLILSICLNSGSLLTDFAQSFMEGFVEGYTGIEEESADEGLLPYNSAAEEKADTVFEDGVSAVVFVVIAVVALVVVSVILIAFIVAVSCFLVNPMHVGVTRFYLRSFDTKPQLGEVFFGFENRYKNIITVMFLKDLYTILWAMLFFVPGIVKAYEYRMIPCLLAENPNLTAKEAFAASKMMMQGQKWKTFILDISFLGWQILSVLTLGILGIFYTAPYMRLSEAALYRRLKGADCIPENVYFDGMEQEEVHGWYQENWYREEKTEGDRGNGVSDSDSRR